MSQSPKMQGIGFKLRLHFKEEGANFFCACEIYSNDL